MSNWQQLKLAKRKRRSDMATTNNNYVLHGWFQLFVGFAFTIIMGVSGYGFTKLLEIETRLVGLETKMDILVEKKK